MEGSRALGPRKILKIKKVDGCESHPEGMNWYSQNFRIAPRQTRLEPCHRATFLELNGETRYQTITHARKKCRYGGESSLVFISDSGWSAE